MSGIVGIINFDGRPVDGALIETLTQAMKPWGPDRLESASRGIFGLGFAQLRTTDEAVAEIQPLSFEGEVHIVADARIDGRAELIGDLKRDRRNVSGGASDAALILHAYHAWGCKCVDRLLGDFAFAIWDAGRGRLFCARDHLGVKPFFYADIGNTLVFGNALDVVRMHPSVGSELNELAIADFLLFGFNQMPDTTAFEDVRRLPPAHSLTCTMHERATIERYWTLPSDEAVRYRRQSEYVEHFREVFRIAVADRLPSGSVGVSMSGGLDSTSVASMAHHLSSNDRHAFHIDLYTNVYERLIPDEEGHYAGQVARALNIPIHFEAADDAEIQSGWHEPGMMLPEPMEGFGTGAASDASRQRMSRCRVMLTGFGGDPALAAPRAYVLNRILRGELPELARGLWSCLRTHRRLPSLGFRAALKAGLGDPDPAPPMPDWLNPDLVERLDLEPRWEQMNAPAEPVHPVRPEAHEGLGDASWPYFFGVLDPGYNGAPVEHRHPFFDVRLIRYVLAMPSQPWFERKALLREAMRGMLPDPVRLRPKTVLRGDPEHAVSVNFDRPCRERLLTAPGLSSFVDKDAVPVHIWEKPALASHEYYGNVRAFSLGYWLSYCCPGSSGGLARGLT
jgi:asparagine synthase (glutamine-hydrolysing)